MADLAQLAFHEVEVVEQPLGGGRDRLATPHVAGMEWSLWLGEHLLAAVPHRQKICLLTPLREASTRWASWRPAFVFV